MALDAILAIVPTVVDCTFVPIKRQLSYAFNYKRKVEKLKNQVEKLASQRDSLQRSVDEATRRGDAIKDDVQKWLADVNKTIEDSDEFVNSEEQGKPKCLFGLIPNLKQQYRLGKKAAKEALIVVEIQDEGRFERISYRPPLEPILAPSVIADEALQSRVSTLEKVMDALKDPDVNMIGVYGMGGVGKTTLAREVHRKAIEEKLFDVIVMTTVSETPEVRKIQGKIADMVELKLEEETEDGRACRLRQRLKNEKKILIILDDIWEQLEPEKVGIPFGKDHSGCKILLTSRRQDLLSQNMGAQRNFELRELSDAEAWSLFERTVGGVVNQEKRSVATKVAKKCSGLPLLIVTVAKTLKNRELAEWKVALDELSRVDDEGMQARAYAAIELSYKHLGDEVKLLFLLCGQLAQHDIQIEDLLVYSVGLNLLRHAQTIESARNRVHKLINNLKAFSLLLDDDSNGIVKMHDVVRDASLSIASRSQHLFTFRNASNLKEWPKGELVENCNRIVLPSCEILELPERLNCPALELFVLGARGIRLRITDSFFEGCSKLRAVHLTGMYYLPSSFGFPSNIITLCFDNCALLDVAFIGQLKRIQILKFRECEFKQLPVEIGQLTELKLLDLSRCYRLINIPANVISRFSLLEELYMLGSFSHWEVDDLNNPIKASLAELKHLSYLKILEINIQDTKMIPKDLSFSKLERYKIVTGRGHYIGNQYESSRLLSLTYDTDLHLEQWFRQLLKETEDLSLWKLTAVKKLLYDLNSQGYPQLKHLRIGDCHDIQALINSTKRVPYCAFPILESFYLRNLMSLENICQGQLTTGSFSKLRILKVDRCNKLKNLFSFSMVRNLLHLQEMEVISCEHLEAIIFYENGVGDDNTEGAEFSQLHTLRLKYLPRLKSFCYEEKAFPTLQTRQGQFATGSGLGETISEDELEMPLALFDGKIFFPNLEYLSVYSIGFETELDLHEVSAVPLDTASSSVSVSHNLKYLFTSSFLKSLLRVKKLDIETSEFMEGIVLMDKLSGDRMDKILFPNLDELTFHTLPNLTRFCDECTVEFCSLVKLNIENCSAFKTFVSSHLSSDIMTWKDPNLEIQTTTPLFDEKVAFPSLEDVTIVDMDNLERIWSDQLSAGSFCKLKSINLRQCPNLHTLFPSNDLRRFQKLKSLHLDGCYSLNEIYQLQGINVEEASSVTAFNLEFLVVIRLPKLKHIWSKDPQRKFTFQNLVEINVSYCKALESLFPASIAKGLVLLESILLESCGLKEIVGQGHCEEAVPSFEFPQLNSFKLTKLPNLSCFYPEVHSLEFPKLKDLKVVQCAGELAFASEEVHGNDEHDILLPQPLFIGVKAFPNLEKLWIDGQVAASILQSQLPIEFIPSIKSVVFQDSGGKSIFPLFQFLKKLPNLRKFSLWNSSLRELLQYDGLGGTKEDISMPPPQIRDLQLHNLGNLKEIWRQDFKLQHALEYLESVELWQCGSLINFAPPFVTFQNLSTLEIAFCEGLTHLMASSTARSLVQLTKMRIKDCDNLTEIVTDGQDDTREDIIFKKLKNLELESLESLTSFCLGGYAIEFPSLEAVTVVCCPNMRNFSAGLLSTPKLQCVQPETLAFWNWLWEGSLNSTIQKLHMEMFGFRDISKLKLSKFPHLKEKWGSQISFVFLDNVSNLVVDKCELLSKALSSNQLKFLEKLKVLIVERCDAVEEVFDVEGLNEDEGCNGPMSRLHELRLIDLPLLRHTWDKDQQKVLGLKNLKLLEICNCSKLRNVFTISIALGLVQLQSLEVRGCTNVAEIINSEGKEEFTRDINIFPSLRSVKLGGLPSLITFYSGDEVLKCPLLKEIEVTNCPKMKIHVSTFPIKIESGVSIEGNEESSKECFHIPTLCDKFAIQGLEVLKAEWSTLKDMLNERFHAGLFCSLEVVELIGISSEYENLASDFLRRLPNLEKLTLGDSLIEEIVLHEPITGQEECSGSTALLKTLSFSKLSKLKHIVEENSSAFPVFGYLENLEVLECCRLKLLVPHPVSFQNLTILTLSKCRGMISLITSSTARSLVKLQRMTVEECEILKEIVASEGDGVVNEIRFSRLEYLELQCLPCLTSFCSANVAFNFPSLAEVIVRECPKMTIFAQEETLCTPKLRCVESQFGWNWEGSLNNTIHELFTKMADEQH